MGKCGFLMIALVLGRFALGVPVGLAADTAPRELDWVELMPPDYQPDMLLAEEDIGNLDDADPRAAELLLKLQALWRDAPVVRALDGAEIRLPGFAIPLDTDTKVAKSFILVPYYGACIHTPPPPSNQIVLVRAPQGARIEEAFAMVWVTGRLRVEAQQTDVAHAGYTLDANSVEPYEE